MEKVFAPYLFGALVGFLSFYFIRKYTKFTPKSLGATLCIIFADSALPSVMVYVGDVDFVYRYLIGVFFGVLLYLIYLIILKRLKEKGKIFDFEGHASCGISHEELDEMIEEFNKKETTKTSNDNKE